MREDQRDVALALRADDGIVEQPLALRAETHEARVKLRAIHLAHGLLALCWRSPDCSTGLGLRGGRNDEEHQRDQDRGFQVHRWSLHYPIGRPLQPFITRLMLR